MTEAEWLNPQTHPGVMYNFVSRKTPPRKLQLIAVGVCRLLEDLESCPVLTQGVIALERFAEGVGSEEEFVEARQAVYHLTAANRAGVRDNNFCNTVVASAMFTETELATKATIGNVARQNVVLARARRKLVTKLPHRCAINDILHEVIGNPFRHYLAVPSWQGGGVIQPDGRTVMFTDAVKGIADAVHVTGDFGRLPILADALEEAGVTDEVLLDHCRDGGPHLRGCWALDVVRGRA